ncbi:MAG: magnesium transporter [Planctomycetota bacterium]
MPERKINLSEIQLLLDESRIQAAELLRQGLKRYKPEDLAELLDELDPEDKVRLIAALETEQAAEVIDETDPTSREEVLRVLPSPRISEIVDAMPPDEGADLVSSLPADQQTEILDTVEKEHAEDLRELMEYSPDSAGGMMTTEFVSVGEGASVSETLETLRLHTESETIAYVYIVGAEEKLMGIVSVRDLLEHGPEEKIGAFMERDVVSVGSALDQEDVANTVNRYNLNAVPVVDDQDRMLGIITVDDVLDVIDEEVDEDMFRIAGTVSKDPAREALGKKYIRRLPFLLTTFVGGGLTVVIQYFFRFTTDQLVALTFYIPIILGLSGNVALQASTVMVRSFATGDIELREVFRFLPVEVGAGGLIGITFGLLCGGFTSLIAGVFGASPWLGVTVGVSLAMGTTVAAILGTLVPSFCEWAGIDPAIAAGPFIVTLIDTTAMTIYLGIAAAMFHLLR